MQLSSISLTNFHFSRRNLLKKAITIASQKKERKGGEGKKITLPASLTVCSWKENTPQLLYHMQFVSMDWKNSERLVFPLLCRVSSQTPLFSHKAILLFPNPLTGKSSTQTKRRLRQNELGGGELSQWRGMGEILLAFKHHSMLILRAGSKQSRLHTFGHQTQNSIAIMLHDRASNPNSSTFQLLFQNTDP